VSSSSQFTLQVGLVSTSSTVSTPAILETTTAERLATGVQQQLGHACIRQTADTYGHVQPERHEAAVEGLDRYVS